MKIFFTLALLLVGSLCLSAQAETPPPPQSKAFDTDWDAIKDAWEKLEKTSGLSAKDIYTSLGLDPKHNEDALAESQSTLDVLAKQFGELVKVDVCTAPKLAGAVRKAGFILLFDHGLAFIDATVLNTGGEWRIVGFKLLADSSAGTVLKAIPKEYFNK